VPPLTDHDHPAVRAWAELDARVVEAACGGVPVFWAEMPGPLRAQLAFRVGRVDEQLSRAGISHLVEHLALSTLGERLYGYNGAVGGDTTTFSVSGTVDEVREFFAMLCAALRALPLDRLEAERTVLLTEAARRSPDPVAALLWARYGATGFGLLGVDEHGLRAAGGDDVQAWAAERFTAANAVLLLTGPPPADLELDLPDGIPFPIVAASEPVEQPLPTSFRRQSAVVAVAGTLGHGYAGRSAFARHLQGAMARRLRTELGITYSVLVNAVWINEDVDHVAVVADALEEKATAVASGMHAELDRIAREGVDQAELDRDVEQMRRAGELPDAVGAVLQRRANAVLRRRAYVSMAERSREVVAVQPSDIATFAAELRDSAMWLLPLGAKLNDAVLHPYVEWSKTPVRADRYFKPLTPQGADGPIGLAIGEQGVSLVLTGSRFVTVRWENCVGAQTWSTGQWAIFGKDGFRLTIDPQAWDCAAEIQRTIESRVPERLRVPMGELARRTVAPRKRTWWSRLRPYGIAVGPLIMAMAGWSSLQSTTTPVVQTPTPIFSVDPNTLGVTIKPGTTPPPPPPETHFDPGALALAAGATGGTVAAVAFAYKRSRR
jgi:predicted Zn-dependent peptidase